MTRENDKLSNTILWISIRTLINFIFVFLLVESFTSSYHFSYKLFADLPYEATSKKEEIIQINEGENALEIASELDEKGIVDGKYLFLARVYLGKYNNKIKEGQYTLGPGMTPEEICRIICGLQQGENDS